MIANRIVLLISI
uniref:Uncharacterized protein n=1 Tax=Arundo donax TaxID=35708 RepID=A0A0A9C1K5_ARUDO